VRCRSYYRNYCVTSSESPSIYHLLLAMTLSGTCLKSLCLAGADRPLAWLFETPVALMGAGPMISDRAPTLFSRETQALSSRCVCIV